MKQENVKSLLLKHGLDETCVVAAVSLLQEVVENCAIAAEHSARSFAEPVPGCTAAAAAVRHYGEVLLK